MGESSDNDESSDASVKERHTQGTLTLGELVDMEQSEDPEQQALAKDIWSDAVGPIGETFQGLMPKFNVNPIGSKLASQLAGLQRDVIFKSGIQDSLRNITASQLKIKPLFERAELPDFLPARAELRVPDVSSYIASMPNLQERAADAAADTAEAVGRLIEIAQCQQTQLQDVTAVLNRLVEHAELTNQRENEEDRVQTLRYRLMFAIAVLGFFAGAIAAAAAIAAL